jgi:hypothetical protein
MLESYVGITGFKSRTQVAWLSAEHTGSRKLMVGVLASYRTIMQGQFKPDGRSPKREDIAKIFSPVDAMLNMVHYYTEDQTNLELQLACAMGYGGLLCQGLQLNIAWPDPEAIRAFRDSFERDPVIVIQLGGRRWPLTDLKPRALSLKVLDLYDGIADYILLDPSGGLGKEMDVAMLLPYLETLEAHLQVARRPMGLAIAGGLCAENLNKIRPLCEQFPRLSFDAEGKLHSGPGQLDLDRCRRYLEVARTLP